MALARAFGQRGRERHRCGRRSPGHRAADPVASAGRARVGTKDGAPVGAQEGTPASAKVGVTGRARDNLARFLRRNPDMARRPNLGVFKRLLREFNEDNPLLLAAALSYYTLLSLAPLILVVTALAALVFQRAAVEGQLVAEMRDLVGDAGSEVIQSILRTAGESKGGGLSLGIGLLTLLFGATTVFGQLQYSLNKIWDVEATPDRSAIWSFVRTRLLSFTMVIGLGFLLLVSLIVSAGLAAAGAWASGMMPLTPAIWEVINALVSFVIVGLLVAMIFKVLPDAEIAWRDVWFGAAVTSLLFTVGKFLIGLYLGRASIGSTYGAAGSVVVLLVWVYYASLILFLGAEITHVHAKEEGVEPPPTEHAVRAAR
jgi:membrane protein